MIRRVVASVFVLAAVFTLVGCDPAGRPTLPPAFGARVIDGKLHIWTGTPCPGVTELGLDFDPVKDDPVSWALKAPGKSGTDVEFFTFGEPVPGLDVTKAPPPGFDWRKAELIRIDVDGAQAGWGTTAHVAEIVNGSAGHPEDTYWFEEIGWLNPAEVAAKNGKTFLTTCTPHATK